MAGRYESWFVSAHDPAVARALWIRHTRHRRLDGAESVALWCTLFDPEPAAVKPACRCSRTPTPDAHLPGPTRFTRPNPAGGRA